MLTILNNNKDPIDGFMSVDNWLILISFWLSDSSMWACEKNYIYVCVYVCVCVCVCVCIYICFFIFFSIMVYYKILSRVPYGIK